MHVFIGNFTYIVDFMIVEDISSIVDPRLSQVVLGRPFVEIANMTHDPPEGVVRFINGTNEVTYKMPHKIEKYDSLSDLEKEYTKSIYHRNKEDKRRGVEYVMSKIQGFYKECLELGPEYLRGIDDEGEVTSPSTTLIIEKIDKIEKLIIDGKVTLMDDEGKPLKKVESSKDYDSEDEVASVDNEMASFFARKDGYGQEIPDKLQSICDNLDIKVRVRKKK
ncbi:hypothetical protein Tco_1003387 [Tanacetum coccineum]|uniref:Protein kinase-like domain, concanavalin A-like lectin/glucanase domain protein n=1 Tax=Tanacetum coccineum TaxID=301880 RepID=A0ABQ5FA20_9ASTR